MRLGHSSPSYQERALHASALVRYESHAVRVASMTILLNTLPSSTVSACLLNLPSPSCRPSNDSRERTFTLPPTDGGLHFLCRPSGDPKTPKVRPLRCALCQIYPEEAFEEVHSRRATLAKSDFSKAHFSPCQGRPYSG